MINGGVTMMYPYLTLDDETEIVHSEMLENNAHLIIELSQNGGFDNASGF